METGSALKPARKILAMGILLGALIAPTVYAETEIPGMTLDNLLTAYQGESNANARYLAFANKADEEGYYRAASLFRAAAEAEKIHASNHAAVIRQLGGTPDVKIETPVVKTTRENLEKAREGEIYERDQMYPAFMEQARKEGKLTALKAFNFAKAAEAEHARLYDAALKDLEAWKAPAQPFYVCPVCGYTEETLPEKKCPICFTPKEKFIPVS